MILRAIKQISAADTKRIETMRKKEIVLASLNDHALLLGQGKEPRALAEKLLKYPNLNKKKIANLMKRHVKIGSYKGGENEFDCSNEAVYFRENIFKPADAYFSIGFESPLPFAPLSLKIVLENVFGSELFSILPYANQALGTIEQIATGFYNKREVYTTIYKTFLLKEKVWLEATLGAAFTRNLLALFSVNTKQTKSKTFSITKANAFSFVMKLGEEKNVLGPEYKKIGFSGISCPSPKQLSDIEIGVFLGPNNTLVAEAKSLGLSNSHEYPFSRYYEPRPGKVQFEDNSKLSAVLEKEAILNDFLLNLEQLTDFGYEIYEKVQTNLLVSNI